MKAVFGEAVAPREEGTQLANKVASFIGTAAAVQNVKSIHRIGQRHINTPQGAMDADVDETIVYPDTIRQVMKLPMGEMTSVISPSASFMSTPMGVQDMPGSAKAGALNEMKQDLLVMVRSLNDPSYTFTAAGTEKVGDVDAAVLNVSAAGSQFKLLVDPATGKILRKVSQGRMGEQITEFTEWKSVSGVNLPVAASTTAGGQQLATSKYTTVEINPTVDPKIFEKPAAK